MRRCMHAYMVQIGIEAYAVVVYQTQGSGPGNRTVSLRNAIPEVWLDPAHSRQIVFRGRERDTSSESRMR
jgi:hypothetical protein